MPRISIGLLVVLLLIDIFAGAQQTAKPFPQHAQYHKGTIKPNHISQQQLDGLALDFYKHNGKNAISKPCLQNSANIMFGLK